MQPVALILQPLQLVLSQGELLLHVFPARLVGLQGGLYLVHYFGKLLYLRIVSSRVAKVFPQPLYGIVFLLCRLAVVKEHLANLFYAFYGATVTQTVTIIEEIVEREDAHQEE